MAKNNFKCTCRRPWNLYKYKNSLITTYFSLTIEDIMYLKCLQKPRCLVGSKPAKRSDPPRRKQGWIPQKTMPFVHKKETEHSFELSLSICVFYRRIFNLEMQNFSLENHHMMNARQPFYWSITFTKVSKPFLFSPPKWLTWPLDVCGVYWFSLRIFSQTSLELEFFPRDITV